MILTKSEIKKIDIERFVDDFATAGAIEKFLLIVPTNRRVRKLKKRLIDLTPSKGATVINIETLETFTRKILGENEIFRRLSESAASVFLEQAAEETELEYFSSYKGEIPFGTIEELREVISEFKRFGYFPEDILNLPEDVSPAEKRKARDIAFIYSKYLQSTTGVSAYEVGDVYQRVIALGKEKFREIFASIYPDVENVIVTGFDEFSPPEIEILNILSDLENVKTFIDFDYDSSNGFLFSHLNDCYEALKNKGFRAIEDVSPAGNDKFTSFVRSFLFKNVEKQNERYKDNLFLIPAENREEEIKLIAKAIKENLTEGTAKPNEICVAFNSITSYSQIVRDVFKSYGIPFNLTDRITPDKTAPATAVINLLEIIETNYYYKNILRAFSSGFVYLPGVNIGAIQAAARSLKLTVGLSNWKTQLNQNIFGNENSTEASIFKEALKSIKSIEKLLSPFSKELTIGEFLTELKKLIKEVKLDSLLFKGDDAQQEINIKSLSGLIEAAEEVFTLIEIKEGKGEKFTLEFFLDRLRTIARSARFNVKERPEYGVLVTSVKEIRGLSFKVLFVGGMVDKDFPVRYRPEIFKPKTFAKNEERHLTEQRYLFYQALKARRNKLYLTYPKRELKKELSPSSFLDDFKKLFAVTELTPKDFENAYYSREELLKDFNLLVKNNLTENILTLEEKFKIDTGKIKTLLDIDFSKLHRAENSAEYFGTLLRENIEDGENSKLKHYLASWRHRVFSVTQLETYAKCPFRFFLERILKVEILEEPKEEVERTEFGKILHKILFRFYVESSKKNLRLSNCSDEIFNRAKNLLFQIARDEINASKIFESGLSFHDKEKILGINGREEDSILYKFLETERSDTDGFVPIYFEASFGAEKFSEELTLISKDPVKLGNVLLRGKIDRIEINESEKLFNVVDYKTGGNASGLGKEIREGLSLQLPVYLYAANQFLGEDYTGKEMIIYSLKYKKDDFGKNKINENSARKKASRDELVEVNKSLFDFVEEKVNEYVEKISQGKFPLSAVENREEKVCKYCPFKSICRVAEEKLIVKQP